MRRWRNSNRLVAIGFGALWLAVQAGLFFFGLNLPGGASPHFKVRLGVDSHRYLDAAELLLSGKLPTGVAKRYFGYDLFVALFLWSGLGKLGIVLAQALITAVAAYCLYRLACRLYDRRTGLLAAFLYIVYAEIHILNFYILTESLFISMVVISLFVVVEWRGFWRLAVAGLVVLFACAVRPHGVILAAAIGIYALYSLWRARRYKVFMGVVSLFLLAAPIVIKLLNAWLVYSSILTTYTRGTVIYAYQPTALTMPGVIPETLTNIKSPLMVIPLFIAAKPGYFLQLAGMKLWYFFLHARPFYSTFHNAISIVTLVTSYALAFWGLFSPTDHPAERVLLVSVILFQSLAVALTLADWDGRFLLVILPVVFVFASRGAWRLMDAARALRTSSRLSQ